MKILVIGPSGSGKSYLAREFKKMGMNVYDTDDIDGLSDWYDSKGQKTQMPNDAGPEFLNNHDFVWHKDFLEDFLNKNPDVYLFGMSGNVFEMLDLFDKVYFLKVPNEVILERLDHDTRKNPMGKTEYQKKIVIEWGKGIEQKAKNLRIEFIDGTQSASAILKQIS